MIKDIINYIKLLFQKDKELYFDLKKIIGFYPGDIELYKTALMHKSVMHRNKTGKPVNNERLEFLGDAVLDAVVGDIVYRHFPGKREGFLTNTRSKLVQRETLGKLANELGITKLVLSSGRNQSHNSYLGGNAFEALVGAIYLDRGYDTCMKFMEKRILSKMVNIDKVAYKEVNFKSKLLEWTQKNRINLHYELQEQKKDENGSPMFSYKVMLETVEGCIGKGYSKKESQQMASKLTLDKLKKDKNYLDSVFAAKTERTKMEEEPVLGVPDTEVKEDFIITDQKKEPLKDNQPEQQQPKPEISQKEEKQPKVEKTPKKEDKQPKEQKTPKKEDKQPKVEKTPKKEDKQPKEQKTPKKEDKQPKEEKAPKKEDKQPKEEKAPKKEDKQPKVEDSKKKDDKSSKEEKSHKKEVKQPKEQKTQKKEEKSPKEEKSDKPEKKARNPHNKSKQESELKKESSDSNEVDEFDLSDISHRQMTREEIIAAAEAAAFAE